MDVFALYPPLDNRSHFDEIREQLAKINPSPANRQYISSRCYFPLGTHQHSGRIPRNEAPPEDGPDMDFSRL